MWQQTASEGLRFVFQQARGRASPSGSYLCQQCHGTEGSSLGGRQVILPSPSCPCVHVVATQHAGDVLPHSHQIAVPVGHVLLSNAPSHIKHYYGTLGLDVVAVSQPLNFSWLALSHILNLTGWNTRECTSIPRVATDVFSNSPIR